MHNYLRPNTGSMSVATGTTDTTASEGRLNRILKFIAALWLSVKMAAAANDPRVEAERQAHIMAQMGAKRIGSLAIGIGVVGIVLNQMSDMSIVSNSTGVIDVSSIFDTAGSGLQLLVVGVIIAAAAVLLSLWGNF